MMNLKLFLKYTLAAEQSLMKISNYEAQGTSQDFEEGCKIRRPSQWRDQSTAIVHVEQYERQRNDILELIESKFDDFILCIQIKIS